MPFRLDESVRILKSTPSVFRALLETLPEEWLRAREGAENFSAMDVLGHLIYGEQTDWIPRARIILECGEARPFDPFDRRGFLPLLEGRCISDMLSMFADLRAQNLETLTNLHLGESELDLTGTHPALGRVTMRNLMASWAVHDLGHTAQVARVLASRYRRDVGSWLKYMSILDQPARRSE